MTGNEERMKPRPPKAKEPAVATPDILLPEPMLVSAEAEAEADDGA